MDTLQDYITPRLAQEWEAADNLVTKGVELLDSKLPPGWECRINLNSLDLRSCRYCVLGQVYQEGTSGDSWDTGYDVGVRRLEISYAKANEYGFNRGYGQSNDGERILVGYDILNDAWRQRLAERQAQNCNH